MLILSSEQIRKADRFTIENEPVSSVVLMERASQCCVDFILHHFAVTDEVFGIVCGPGNNGGDGLVIARLLHLKKAKVKVILFGDSFSTDNLHQQNLWKETGEGILHELNLKELIHDSTVIIDCLFGTGLKRKPEGIFASVIKQINESGKKIISIDLPSGMADERQFDFATIVKADITLTFQFPKLAFLLPDSGPYAGDWHILDIGLMKEGFIHEKPIGYFLTKEYVKENFEKRKSFSHKGTFGHASLVGGSEGKTGAIIMAAHACLRSGAGLTTVFTPESCRLAMQTSLPEAMIGESEGKKYLSSINLKKLDFDSMGIGPGLGSDTETSLLIKNIIQNAACPLILDADALNILSENKTWLGFLPEGTILTPHPGEFQRLAGKWNDSYEMIQMQKAFSFRYNCIVVLKGRYTSITTPAGNLFFNSSGNPGLAKGGSGDTLTGVLTALRAQGFSAIETALSGVFLHGLAADIAVKNIHEYSLLAGDVSRNISDALIEIQR